MSKTVQKKENRRVRYTRQALRESLLAQLADKPLNKISVSSVCEKADINRSTFYLYYKDVYDLMEQIEDELYSELLELASSNPHPLPGTDLLRRIYETIYKNRDLARVVFGKFGDKEFMKKVSNIYRDQAISEWRRQFSHLDEETLAYIYTFSTYTNIGVIERWINHDFHETPEQLAQLTHTLLYRGTSAFLKA